MNKVPEYPSRIPYVVASLLVIVFSPTILVLISLIISKTFGILIINPELFVGSQIVFINNHKFGVSVVAFGCVGIIYKIYEARKNTYLAYHKKIEDAARAAAENAAQKKRQAEAEKAKRIKAIDDKKATDRKDLEGQQNAIIKANALRKINMHLTNIRGYLRQIDEGETKPAVILNSIDEEFSSIRSVNAAAIYIGNNEGIVKKLYNISEFLEKRGFEDDFVCAEIREFTENAKKLYE